MRGIIDFAYLFVVRRNFEAAIRTYEGEDALEVWYR